MASPRTARLDFDALDALAGHFLPRVPGPAWRRALRRYLTRRAWRAFRALARGRRPPTTCTLIDGLAHWYVAADAGNLDGDAAACGVAYVTGHDDRPGGLGRGPVTCPRCAALLGRCRRRAGAR
jgi:hypothetical protein